MTTELDYVIYEMYVLSLNAKENILKNCYEEISRLEVPETFWLSSLDLEDVW